MNFQQLVTTGFGTRAWLALGALPPRQGYAFARWLTRQLYRRKHGIVYRVLYGNQRHVLGPGATHEEVDLAVAAVLKHAGMTNYDMIRAVRCGEQAIVDSIELGEDLWPHVEAARSLGRGVIVCGAHLSNFNLGFLSFAMRGNFTIQALSASVPAGGFDVVRDLRNRGMLEDTPIDAASLKKALTRLKSGGAVLIGIDWPMPDTTEGVPFFGAPSLLSAGYVRLALSANAVLLPLTARWTPARGYYAMSCPPVELVRTGDRDHDIRVNALHVLGIVERWIRETPDQWLMYHPVWPEDGPPA
ncbi:MAG: lysophospholipid acyltransferase family protein [Nitrososphaerales archaeon]